MNRAARVLLLLLALAGFATPAGASITLFQAGGSELELSEPARRIVTLSPNLAELAFAAGAGGTLLATVEYSDYPPEAARLTRVGDAFRLDVERIVALRPDLVIAWDSGNPRGAVQQLRALGIRVWSVEIREPGQVADVIADIGRASDTAEKANAAALAFRERLEGLAARYAGAPPLEYFYQVDSRPLFTINEEHLISRGLELCGGRNIFAGEPGLAFQVSHESVIVADPAALIAPSLPDGSDPFLRWREWQGMKAVKTGALFTLDADSISRATPRWLDSIESACTLLNSLRHQVRRTPR